MKLHTRVLLCACAAVAIVAVVIVSRYEQKSASRPAIDSPDPADLGLRSIQRTILEVPETDPTSSLRTPEVAKVSAVTGSPTPTRALSEVEEMRKLVLTKNLPLLDGVGITLKSAELRETMATSIAVILDASGRGTPRVEGRQIKIPSSTDGNYTITYNGTTYTFRAEEFPEYDYYWKNRRLVQPDFPGMDTLLALVKQRASAALKLLD